MRKSITRTRRFALIGLVMVALIAVTTMFVRPAGATVRNVTTTRVETQPETLRQLLRQHQLASTVQVLSSQAPSVIIQLPLFPSGIKKAFPNATGVVTIVEGNPAVSLADSVTVDVQHMPPFQKFTVFFVESSSKPFGHAEYVGDVITRGDGSGESIFHLITFVAFAADARNSSVTSTDQTGVASGVQLEHVGMWFDGVKAARQVLQNSAIPGTPFDGGNPALHAGPQVMTDGQTSPVI